MAEKASELHQKMDLDSEFTASKGWLWRFCKCHGIRELSFQGEKLSADATAIDPCKRKLHEVMGKEGLTLEQLYNCDETELYYRMMQAKTLASRYENGAEGMKKQKDRVTLMERSNATGNHRLPLVLIGKSANPRCFKNINKDALPVKYCAQRSAWMNSSIFSDWLSIYLFHQ